VRADRPSLYGSMPMQTTLGDGTTTWVLFRAGRISGTGRVSPRLGFTIFARTPRERMRVQLHVMRAELIAGRERLGECVVTGIDIVHGEYNFTVEIPVDRAALVHIESIATASRIDLTLRLSGWMLGQDENTDGPAYAGSPQPGEWVFQAFGVSRQTELMFQLARSDWFTDALEPIGTLDYLCTEIALPRGDHPLRQAVNQLHAAERAFAEGDDPAVFSRCRGAIDALPGAPKTIFDGLPDPHESVVLDDLLLKAGTYLHRGRHVARSGEREGDFPIDHADARFALNLAKLLIAHVAHVLRRGT
jgi:hypothetical protein